MSKQAKRLAALVAVLGVGAAGAAVATAGDDNSRVAGGDHAAQNRQRPVLASAAKSRKPVTVESSFVIQPGDTDGRGVDCPSRAPYAVSGYWGTDDASREPDVTNVRSTPIGKTGTKWEVAVKNTGTDPLTVYVGTVCVPK